MCSQLICIIFFRASKLVMHHNLLFVSSRNAPSFAWPDKNGWEVDNNLLSLSFFNLTTLKTIWYPKLRWDRLFTTVSAPWSFYKAGPHFTSNMEPLVIFYWIYSFWISIQIHYVQKVGLAMGFQAITLKLMKAWVYFYYLGVAQIE